MIIESLFIGLVLGFLFYEIVGISPGGVIPPGYLALSLHEPGRIAVTVGIAAMVWLMLEGLSRVLVIYGRRRLLLALLLGFCFKLAIEFWLRTSSFPGFSLESIGYIIPGLIANEMVRQDPLPTLSALGIVTVCVYFTLLLLHPLT
jgi:poly-gamma-glutamate biosynthesis protein PgsC/CapC